MKYTCSITRHSNASTLRSKVVLRAGVSEVAWHIALKILGFILFMQHKPLIEEGVGWHYKPDLVAFTPTGAISLWVDCGNIAVRKIDRVASWLPKEAEFHILRRTAKDAMTLAAAAKNIKKPERLLLTAFDTGFVDAVAESLGVTNRMDATLSDNRLVLQLANRGGEQLYTTDLHYLSIETHSRKA